MQSFLDMFVAGGFVMYPLALCSLITWAIAMERAWTLRQVSKEIENLGINIQKFLEKGDRQSALEYCIKSSLPAAKALEELMQAGIKQNAALTILTQKASRKRLELNQEYKKYLWALGTIGSATPFLGLFGTVVGILRAFKHIASSGETGFAVVASGISEALIATAAGIIVAVIAVALYNYFQVYVSKLSLQSRLLLEEFLEAWAASSGGSLKA